MEEEEKIEEKNGEKKKPEEPKYPVDGSKSYFKEMGLNPEIHKNNFGPDEALAIFAKAKDALETRKDNKKLISDICRQAWGLFKILA